MKFIGQFAEFIKNERREDVVKRQSKFYSINNNIPSAVNTVPKQRQTIFKERLPDFLTALTKYNEPEYIQGRLLRFQSDQTPIVSSKISLFYVMQAALLQKVAITEFIPFFIKGLNEVLELIPALEQMTMYKRPSSKNYQV